ncbi:MAG: hypothetical protein KME27_04810 [Lyngbya sp. HA4199-MV5]|nr:hypothetical protein [Lyngbya sp. HA4199-MV5]
MHRPKQHGWLLRVASNVLMTFLLSLFGLLVALLLAGIVESLPLINLLLNLLEQCLPKAIALVLCIVGVAVVLESMR